MHERGYNRDLNPAVQGALEPVGWPAPTITRQVAVIVGVSAYADSALRLANAAGDAQTLGQLLVDQYGFTLMPLLDEAASLAAIQAVVTDTLQAATTATRWLFYFAGHGRAIGARGYLLPADAHRQDPLTYLPLEWLLAQCRSSHGGEILVVLDACYAGRALVQPDQLSDLIPQHGDQEHVRQLLTSGNPDQPVLDGGGHRHSVFTQALLETLAGWTGIHEDTGVVMLTPLVRYLAHDVPKRVATLGHAATRQQPLGGNLVGNRQQRDVSFEPICPRLDAELVRGTRSTEPHRRAAALQQLSSVWQANAALVPLAQQLALRHLRRSPEAPPTLPADHLLAVYHESEPAVRCAAVAALGALSDTGATVPLLAAYDDDAVVRQAVLRAVALIGDRHASGWLRSRLPEVPDALFLDIVGAIGALHDAALALEAFRESLRRDRLVLVIGPDLPEQLTGCPSRAELARRLARAYHLPEHQSLATVASQLMDGPNRSRIVTFLQRQLTGRSLQPGAIYSLLARLPTPYWISGTYDDVLPTVLGATSLFTAEQARLLRPARRGVLRLVGSITHVAHLLVTAADFGSLRRDEAARAAFVTELLRVIQHRVIVFIGFDPASPDFPLLTEHILETHLASADAQAFLIADGAAPAWSWNGRPVYPVIGRLFDIIAALGEHG